MEKTPQWQYFKKASQRLRLCLQQSQKTILVLPNAFIHVDPIKTIALYYHQVKEHLNLTSTELEHKKEPMAFFTHAFS
jgi:hypothetical protein